MVDVHSPANGDGPGSPEQAETSRDGLRRMQRISESARVSENLYAAMFHPTTSAMVYPPAAPQRHHVVASVFGSDRPRGVPFPSVWPKSDVISVSPDGRWICVFHPGVSNMRGEPGVGDIVIYSSTVLEPSTTAGTVTPIANLPLSSPPLAMLHVYPPRTRLSPGGASAAPPLGPAPPPGHGAAKARGPTLIVLTAELVYLFHPHPLPGTVVLDTRSSHAVPTESVSATGTGGTAPLNWTINTLRCPLGARAYADIANPGPMTSTFHAERGWLGMVGDNSGVWAAVETEGRVDAMRIDVGLDANNIPYLGTTPLPALPRPRPAPFADARSPPEALLDDVVFVPLKDGAANGSVGGDSKAADPGIGLVRVYRDVDGSGDNAGNTRSRMRFELCELRYRPAALVEGFKELGSGTDAPTAHDWFPSLASRTTTTSPEGTTILALRALPDVPPHTLALALVSSPNGLALTHVNLVPPPEGDTDGTGSPRWHALTGEERVLPPAAGTDATGGVTLVPTQGVLRGEMGFVGMFSTQPARLVPAPRLGADAAPVETLKHTAERAARSVELAVVQGVDWSDAVCAAFALVSRHEAAELAAAILEQALNLFIKHSRSYVPHILRLQVAVWALTDDPRRALSAELLRIGEASQAFYLCGSEKDGVVSFDLDSVWNLVDVFEWGLGVLGQVMRDAVAERGQSEWAPTEPRTEGSSRLLYFVHPLLRRILSRFIALLDAFAKFATGLDVPIRAPESAFMLSERSAPAAAVASSRVQDALEREGVDLKAWGEFLGSVGKGTRPSDADTCASLLRLDLAPLASLLPSALQAVPASSALFAPDAAAEPAPRDGATFELVRARPTATCDRCAAPHVLAASNVMRGAVPSPWAAWKRTWTANCLCGGTWVRNHLEPPPGLRTR